MNNDNASQTDVSLFKALFATDAETDNGLSREDIITKKLASPLPLGVAKGAEEGDVKYEEGKRLVKTDPDMVRSNQETRSTTGDTVTLDNESIKTIESPKSKASVSVSDGNNFFRAKMGQTQASAPVGGFGVEGYKAPGPEQFTDSDVKRENRDPNIRREKQEILFNLLRSYRDESRGQWTMSVPLFELRYELLRRQRHTEEQEQIYFMKQMMKLILRGIEVVNKKFGPFLELDGWSESVTQDMHRYDRALKALYHRYFKRKQSNPIIDILWLIGGSMLMFHLKNKFMGRRPMQPEPSAPNSDHIKTAHDIQPPNINNESAAQESRKRSSKTEGIDIGSLLKLFGS